MALQKPYDMSIRGKTIDAAETIELTWKVSGDVQVAYKIDILLNSTNAVVWTSNKINSYALKHDIPPASIANGNEYKIRITIYNQAGSSITSDADIFQTASRPVITIDSIGTVNSFSYNFSAVYYQAQLDLMRNYIVYLYDDKKNLIDKSNLKTIQPMEHLFTNLQTEKEYYVEFQATSVKGLTGTSGLIKFDVFYFRPKMSVDLQAKNIENAGIQLSWYVRQIIMRNNGGVFINNEKMDVRNGSVIADQGYHIDQDFTMKVWIESPYQSNVVSQVDLVLFSGDNGTLKIQYWDDKRFHFWKIVKGISSHWYSKEVTGNSFVVIVKQVDRDCEIISEVTN